MPASANAGIRRRARLGQRREPVVVGREQLGAEIGGNRPPWHPAAVLPAPDDQAAGFRLGVEPGVGIAECRQIRWQLRDPLRDDILMFYWTHGQIRARKRGCLRAPHPRRVHGRVALDPALGREQPDNPASRALDAGDGGVLGEPDAECPRAGREGVGELARVGVAVRGHPDGAADAVGPQQRELVLRLRRGDQVRVESEAPGGRDQALQLVPAIIA